MSHAKHITWRLLRLSIKLLCQCLWLCIWQPSMATQGDKKLVPSAQNAHRGLTLQFQGMKLSQALFFLPLIADISVLLLSSINFHVFASFVNYQFAKGDDFFFLSVLFFCGHALLYRPLGTPLCVAKWQILLHCYIWHFVMKKNWLVWMD